MGGGGGGGFGDWQLFIIMLTYLVSSIVSVVILDASSSHTEGKGRYPPFEN